MKYRNIVMLAGVVMLAGYVNLQLLEARRLLREGLHHVQTLRGQLTECESVKKECGAWIGQALPVLEGIQASDCRVSKRFGDEAKVLTDRPVHVALTVGEGECNILWALPLDVDPCKPEGGGYKDGALTTCGMSAFGTGNCNPDGRSAIDPHVRDAGGEPGDVPGGARAVARGRLPSRGRPHVGRRGDGRGPRHARDRAGVRLERGAAVAVTQIDVDERQAMADMAAKAVIALEDRIGGCFQVPNDVAAAWLMGLLARKKDPSLMWREGKFTWRPSDQGLGDFCPRAQVLKDLVVDVERLKIRGFVDMELISRLMRQNYVVIATGPTSKISVRVKRLGVGLDVQGRVQTYAYDLIGAPAPPES